MLLNQRSRISRLFNRRVPYRGPLKLAVLDWSGTTLDNHSLLPNMAIIDAFAKYGIKITPQQSRKPMGIKKDKHIAKILEDIRDEFIRVKSREPNKDDVQNIFEYYMPLQLEYIKNPAYTRLLPHVKTTVDTLHNKFNMRVGLTTGFNNEISSILYKSATEQGLQLDACVAGDDIKDGIGSRPNPFMLYENMLRLKIAEVQSVVKVDDTIEGVQEGINAGAWTVAVSDASNYTDVDSLEQWYKMSDIQRQKHKNASKLKLIKQSGAHYVIDNLGQLPDVVVNINSKMCRGINP